MKQNVIIAALLGFIVGVGVFVLSPAGAQPAVEPKSWDLIVTPYSSDAIGLVKHNRDTGQTLILTCRGNCGEKQKWYEYQVANEN